MGRGRGSAPAAWRARSRTLRHPRPGSARSRKARCPRRSIRTRRRRQSRARRGGRLLLRRASRHAPRASPHRIRCARSQRAREAAASRRPGAGRDAGPDPAGAAVASTSGLPNAVTRGEGYPGAGVPDSSRDHVVACRCPEYGGELRTILYGKRSRPTGTGERGDCGTPRRLPLPLPRSSQGLRPNESYRTHQVFPSVPERCRAPQP